MKKILKSILVLGVVGAFVFGVTKAFFSDKEKSSGNVFQAGKIDLKIDHLMASYNGIDCHTCSVVLISDESNVIVEKDNIVVDPFSAVYAWVHSAWTAQEDPTLDAANAEWIWATNPTTTGDAQNGVTYTFEKKFTWFGPPTAGDLWFAVGSDNSVEVWLNDNKIGENLGEFGYKKESMLHIDSATVIANIVQGDNVLQFKVNNFPRPGQTGYQNPGGLIYKFEINGMCEGDFFLSHCNLWGEKDLGQGDLFWNLTDVKPGDYGKNVISMHVYDNDYWACLFSDKDDAENTITDPEAEANDTTPDEGELSKYLDVFIWNDLNHNGVYEPSEETAVNENGFPDVLPLDEPDNPPLTACTTYYYGVAWCIGDLTVETNGSFTCDGSGDQNDAQTDSLTVDLNFYVEQSRNNPDFSCQNLVTPTPAD